MTSNVTSLNYYRAAKADYAYVPAGQDNQAIARQLTAIQRQLTMISDYLRLSDNKSAALQVRASAICCDLAIETINDLSNQ